MKQIIKQYIQPSFLICIAVMLICGGYISFRKVHYGETLIKKALPLKQHFSLMDENALVPYKVINKSKITNKDILESLGTEDYLQWTLEDPTASNFSPVKNCSLFITYYTGNPDQVPHVPEACYTGGGNKMDDKSSAIIVVKDPNSDDIAFDVPATCLTFKSVSSEIWKAESKFTVIYFFKVNGKYKGNRTTTRLALGDLTNEYSYFSKVEIKFFNRQGLYPDKDQAVEATAKLLSVVLPELEKNHWPDWNKNNEQTEDIKED